MRRLVACYGALVAAVPHDSIAVTVGGRRLDLEDQDEIAGALRDLTKGAFPFRVTLRQGAEEVAVSLDLVWTILRVEVSGNGEARENELHDLIADSLALSEPTEEDRRGMSTLPDLSGAIWRTFDRVGEVLQRLPEFGEVGEARALRCFVSFRFDDHSKALAFELRELLELSGAEFVSGLGSEPRSVSQKVLDRLSAGIDLFVVIVTPTGDSAWLHQEIGVAKGRGLPVLVLKEETVEVDQGLLADTEFLVFEGSNVSQTFIGTLQSLRYIREARSTHNSGGPGR